MAKSNKKLGFENVASVSVDYSPGDQSGHTLEVKLGEKNGKFRVYAFLWWHEQDASKEGITDSNCGRGETAEEAVEQWKKNATAEGWDQSRVAKAAYELMDEIEEMDFDD